jgi:hypothetical protein
MPSLKIAHFEKCAFYRTLTKVDVPIMGGSALAITRVLKLTGVHVPAFFGFLSHTLGNCINANHHFRWWNGYDIGTNFSERLVR